ncbi:Delta(12)-fatty-acid desaturase [Blyttiomyces sp. JEL0837]|nr:Delta(12)-fatty-acid desaturase [Blyttiomyces sp. JEL0837]
MPSATPQTPSADGLKQRHSKKTVTSAPYAKEWVAPPFTLKEVRDSIPAECFERNTLKSFSYVFYDLIMVVALFLAATYIDGLAVSGWIKWGVLWPAYWLAQGVVCTGLWVIAHECGHQAFSDAAWINNSVGFVLHSALLVPYYSWKISHSKHHKANAHMTKDQVFIPKTRTEMGVPKDKAIKEHDEPFFQNAPIVELFSIIKQQLFGWPAYITVNASGQPYPGWTSHFHTTSAIFEPKHAMQVIASDIGVAITIGVLMYLSSIYGSLAVIKYYLVPYLWVNHWLVMITYLQHTDVKIPHFREGEWDFLKGALSTVDRDYGILNHFFHHIGDTHVAHHLFSTMPHYNAEKATEVLKKKLGKYYIRDDTNIFVALYRSFTTCKFVEDEGIHVTPTNWIARFSIPCEEPVLKGTITLTIETASF